MRWNIKAIAVMAGILGWSAVMLPVELVQADSPQATAPSTTTEGAVGEIKSLAADIAKAQATINTSKDKLEDWAALLAQLLEQLNKPSPVPAPAPIPVDPAPAPAPAPLPVPGQGMLGPDTILVNQSVIFKVDRATAGNDYTWTVAPDVPSSIDGENRQYTFVSLQNLTKPIYFVSFVSFDKRVQFVRKLIVKGGQEDEPVDPNGPPDDKPVVGDPFKLAPVVLAATKGLAPAAKAEAVAAAKVYRDMQASINNGDWGKPTDPLNHFKLTAINDAMKGKMSLSSPAWDGVRAAINKRVSELYTGNQLQFVGNYGDVVAGIALGLEQTK